jgi:hypothetical protein
MQCFQLLVLASLILVIEIFRVCRSLDAVLYSRPAALKGIILQN